MAAKKTGSARQFILSHPDKSAPEVVDLAKAAGFPTVTTGYVHSARYSAKKTIGPKTSAPKKNRAKKVSPEVGQALKLQARAAAAAAKLASKGVASIEAEAPAAPVKRGPGRPRREQSAVVAPVKRGPGRPRKNAEATAAPVKRGPGRPPKQVGSDAPQGARLLLSGSTEQQFAALAVELGISRAEAILRRVRDVLAKLSF